MISNEQENLYRPSYWIGGRVSPDVMRLGRLPNPAGYGFLANGVLLCVGLLVGIFSAIVSGEWPGAFVPLLAFAYLTALHFLVSYRLLHPGHTYFNKKAS